MDISEFIGVAAKEAAVLVEHPILFLAVIGLTTVIVWRLKGAIDSGEASGLRAQLEARAERLNLAEEQQRSTTQRLKNKIDQLRMQIAAKAPTSTLEDTGLSLQSTATDLVAANTDLHDLLDTYLTTIASTYAKLENKDE
jgi:hypothetical protein